MLRKSTLRSWTPLFLVVLLLVTASVTFAAPGLVNSLSSGVGYDPLTTTEAQRVLTAALGINTREAQSAATSAERSEILLVERHQESKDTYQQDSWVRRADVYVYYYDRDVLEHLIVNTETNAVDERELLQDVQLPPTANEIQNAKQLAFADTAFRAELNAWFRPLTNQDLTSFDQLDAKAFIFKADSMGSTALGDAQTCGVKRCVQLLIYTQNNIAFEAAPVIDLSNQTLVSTLRAGN